MKKGKKKIVAVIAAVLFVATVLFVIAGGITANDAPFSWWQWTIIFAGGIAILLSWLCSDGGIIKRRKK
ncbi:hypothetical protein AUK13_02595 [Candidatus Kuenenbacteria bacterium CG2_30_39_24]|uniref:Uncharacterized protein n=1 Tax=Candidatus Kuenenbacteria bacterium CG2_30_39_24 TaxID=1805236 RepID=A0A1J5F6X1_9BACT|nr:MAG: hypothetical protein AUJ36_02165 [Parcubacteria group bacterium CG1_02_41_26]OIP55675.1 MAG: hypothetical protein AUK13_02595 [Candidatus Kuenenbacteria bacterium CG2_30_39_24]